jgi:hypothetical protein
MKVASHHDGPIERSHQSTVRSFAEVVLVPLVEGEEVGLLVGVHQMEGQAVAAVDQHQSDLETV